MQRFQTALLVLTLAIASSPVSATIPLPRQSYVTIYRLQHPKSFVRHHLPRQSNSKP